MSRVDEVGFKGSFSCFWRELEKEGKMGHCSLDFISCLALKAIPLAAIADDSPLVMLPAICMKNKLWQK